MYNTFRHQSLRAMFDHYIFATSDLFWPCRQRLRAVTSVRICQILTC